MIVGKRCNHVSKNCRTRPTLCRLRTVSLPDFDWSGTGHSAEFRHFIVLLLATQEAFYSARSRRLAPSPPPPHTSLPTNRIQVKGGK
jgi:hypothetical protein